MYLFEKKNNLCVENTICFLTFVIHDLMDSCFLHLNIIFHS